MYKLELSQAELIRIKNTLEGHKQEQYGIMSKLKGGWSVKYQILSESIAVDTEIIRKTKELLYVEQSSKLQEMNEDAA